MYKYFIIKIGEEIHQGTALVIPEGATEVKKLPHSNIDQYKDMKAYEEDLRRQQEELLNNVSK